MPYFIFSGIDSVFNNEFVKSKSLKEILQLFPSHCRATFNFLFGTGEVIFREDKFFGNSGLFIFCCILALLIFSFFKLKDEKHRFVFMLVSAYVLLSPLLLIIQKVIPYERTWIHLMPIFILATSGVLFYLHRLLNGKYLPLAALVIGITYASAMMYRFNNRYYLFYNRDYQAMAMSDFILKNYAVNYNMYTNEMILAGTLEFEMISQKRNYKFEYGYLKNDFISKCSDYDFIIWDKNYLGVDQPPVQDLLIYSNDFVNVYKGKK